MRRLVIAVDCDDVLIRTTPFFVDAYNRQYGTKVTLDKAHVGDEIWETDRATLDGRFAELMETEEYKTLAPSADEIAVLTALSKDHELHVITARRPHERETTQLVLDTYLPGVFTSLELVGFTGSKGEVCERINADILIDDNLRHLEDAIKHGLPKEGAILFGDYAWNIDSKGSFTRCHTWAEVQKEIDRLGRT